MKNQKVQCNPPYDCFNCPYEDCMTSKRPSKNETAYLKVAKLPVRGGIIPIAEDLKYTRHKRLV